MPGNTCVFPTQGLSIVRQLEFGIRYLRLDICIFPKGCNESSHGNLTSSSRLVSCRGSETDTNFNGFAFSENLVDILRQVDNWMGSNTTDVIGIHFTSRILVSHRPQVFSRLAPVLEGMWGSETKTSVTRMSIYYNSFNSTWPTLRQAIQANQRIFIFVDDGLNPESRPWVNPTPFITFEPVVIDRDCAQPGIIDRASLCSNSEGDELVLLTGYTLAICISTGQANCNALLQNASDVCYDLLEEVNKTVNVVMVNFPELGIGNDSVFTVVANLNNRNIMRFSLEREVTTMTEAVTTTMTTTMSVSDTTTTLSRRNSTTDSSGYTTLKLKSSGGNLVLSTVTSNFISLLITSLYTIARM